MEIKCPRKLYSDVLLEMICAVYDYQLDVFKIYVHQTSEEIPVV